MDELEQKALAMGDQAWAGLQDCLTDVERIAETGSRNNGYDDRMVRMVFNAALGKLCFDRALACDK